MNREASKDLVIFDQHGMFEIVDHDLLRVVAAGKLVAAPPTPEADAVCIGANGACANKSCYNSGCHNDACVGNGNNVGCL